ncbi:hypothetical protein GCM10010994_00160 [Chelatococcus reniformis]|uniref:Uncharacterized protein n=1 Tax=Chelatococcus reniformis TaxID=1494448 RepID=A0A916X6G6_9HYPH|nr:hypothetical protein GCM10010994_00160 [Chelatococcus reniformis]
MGLRRSGPVQPALSGSFRAYAERHAGNHPGRAVGRATVAAAGAAPALADRKGRDHPLGRAAELCRRTGLERFRLGGITQAQEKRASCKRLEYFAAIG